MCPSLFQLLEAACIPQRLPSPARLLLSLPTLLTLIVRPPPYGDPCVHITPTHNQDPPPAQLKILNLISAAKPFLHINHWGLGHGHLWGRGRGLSSQPFWSLKNTQGIRQFLCQQDHWHFPTSCLVIVHGKFNSSVPSKRKGKPCFPPYLSVFFGHWY